MIKQILTVSSIVALAWIAPMVNAQPIPKPGPVVPRIAPRAPILGPRTALTPRFTPRAPAFRPYFNPRFAPPVHWGPPRFWGPAPYRHHRDWFFFFWFPAPWPVDYYYYYPAPSATYNYYYGNSSTGYQYDSQYQGYQSQEPKYSEQNTYKQEESEQEYSGYSKENYDPQKAQQEYETWITGQLGLKGQKKNQFITQLRNLQSTREAFMEKRNQLTVELSDLQQQNPSNSELNRKMNEIQNLDRKFQKDEQAAISKLLTNLTVEQKAKYYSLQAQSDQSQEEQETQP